MNYTIKYTNNTYKKSIFGNKIFKKFQDTLISLARDPFLLYHLDGVEKSCVIFGKNYDFDLLK